MLYRRASRPRLPALLAATALVVVWGCSEDAETLTTLEPEVAAQFATQGNGPPLVPNGVPYTQPDYKHATGRSGEATLAARALLGKDGTTELEVTSGEIDGAAGTREISKLQLKFFSSEEHELGTENHNKVDATHADFAFDHLMRHAEIQLQGNVRTSNARGKERTGVVTIRERVNLRPDLAALALSGPAQAAPGVAITFQADVAELNGDLSATADCVFYVDGVETTRAAGIWVGEGDLVNCGFAHSFPDPGTYTVSVGVEDVHPGDWDTANNTASHTIEIVSPEIELHGYASADEYHYFNRYRNYGSYYYSDGYNYTSNYYDYYRDNRYSSTYTYFYGWAPGASSYPLTYSVSQSTNGWTFDQAAGNATYPNYYGCVYHNTGKGSVQICPSGSGLSVSAQVSTGRSYYYSYDYWNYYNCYYYSGYGWSCSSSYGNYYYYNNYWWGHGPLYLGNDVTWDVEVATGSGTTFVANPSVTLTSYSSSGGTPYYCNSGSSYYGSWYSCYENIYSYESASGWTNY